MFSRYILVYTHIYIYNYIIISRLAEILRCSAQANLEFKTSCRTGKDQWACVKKNKKYNYIYNIIDMSDGVNLTWPDWRMGDGPMGCIWGVESLSAQAGTYLAATQARRAWSQPVGRSPTGCKTIWPSAGQWAWTVHIAGKRSGCRRVTWMDRCVLELGQNAPLSTERWIYI